jgi:hypothetical protein
MNIFEKIQTKLKIHTLKAKKKEADLFDFNLLYDLKHLNPYYKYCTSLIDRHYNLYFGVLNKKNDIEHSFGMLALTRSKDYFLEVISSISKVRFHSSVSLLRSLTETLFLLKYMDKNPDTIIKFMRKQNPKFYNIVDIKKAVADKRLNEFYHQLALLDHANRIALKQTFYTKDFFSGAPSDTRAIISDMPLNYKEQQVSHVISALSLYKECLDLIEKIMNTEWKAKAS